MSLTKTQVSKQYYKARKNKYAIGAFNYSTVEVARSIAQASNKLKSPVIIATSCGEMDHLTSDISKGIVDGLKKTNKNIILHLDHGKDFGHIKNAVSAGYDSIHCDGSALLYKDNVRLTKKSADLAHKNDKWIEGELGHIGGSSTLHAKEDYSKITKEAVMTDPIQAKEFVEITGIDSLAVNIGNVHGLWKGLPHIDFVRLKHIYKLVKIPLVLHGGSGIAPHQIKKGLQFGICKINVNSELRIAYSTSVRNSLKDKNMFVPTKYLPDAIKAVQAVVENKMRLFGSVGKL